MRILNVIENVDERTGGGAAERCRQISLHLGKLGHQVKILTTNVHLDNSENSSLNSLTIIAIPYVNKRFYIPFPALFTVNRLIKESEIIQLFSHWTILNVLVFIFIKFHKKPYIVTPLGALPIFGRSSLIKKIYNILVGKRLIKQAERCFIATEGEIDALVSYGVNLNKINHLPNGIDEEDYQIETDKSFRERLKIGDNQYILFIGRLNPIKAPDMLLEAFIKISKEYSDINLVIIGPDEGMLDNLKKVAYENFGNTRVHFLGYVSKSDKAALLKSSLFLTVPSHQEAMSIVVLEAGISGRPALITDQCGFNEVQEVGGGLVVKADTESISQGLSHMFMNKSILDDMGQKLQQKVKKDYLWSESTKEHVKIFSEMINS